MNQPNPTAISSRTAAPAEGLDVFAVIRRYVWLLLAGAVAGAAVSGGLFAYFWKYEPRYTARFPFRVLPSSPMIGQTDQATILLGQEDASQVIHQQMFTFEQDPFLVDIMKDDDFRKDHNHPDDPQYKSGWLRENGADPRQLKKDLVIVPKIDAAAFEITMTTKDPVESYNMVMAAVKVYKQYLKSVNDRTKDASRQGLNTALEKAENTFKLHSDALQLFAVSKGIDVMKSNFEIQKNLLQGLNSDWVKADAQAGAAEAEYASIVKQRESVEKDRAAGNEAEIKLTPEMEQYLENDPTLRTLEATKLSWQQERVGEMAKGASGSGRIKEIDARMEKIDEQVKITRKQLRDDATRRMEEQSKNESIGKRTLSDKIDIMRTSKESLVKSIGQDLMDYQQKEEDLKQEQDVLNKMRLQNSLAEANKYNEDTRVQQMIDLPVQPTDIAWPKWYVFLPIGTIAGLGLSAVLAYLLVLTDTRVRTPRDITRTLQLPMLGFVPDEGDDRTLSGDVETAILTSPASMVAECFRQIRSHILAQTAHNPVSTLLVASIAPGGGATTVAANLAASMALNDLRVLLVDANFYRPSLGRIFKNIPAEGLVDAIENPATLATSIVQHGNMTKLHLLGAGSRLASASSEMFEGKAFRDLLEQLKSKYDLIIFDGAPLNLVSASLALAARVEGVVSVVRAGEVSRGTVTRVRDQLRGVHANLLGFVLNAAQTNNSGYFKENYRTFYRYAGKGARQPVSSQ